MFKQIGLVFGLACALVAASCQKGPKVDAERIVAAEKNGEWLSYGRTYSEQRFSPLDKINASNVSGLGLAWYGDFDTDRGQEATPIVVDGVLYTSTSWSNVYAYDARTGKQLWKWDAGIDKAKGFQACCDTVNRGVAAWDGAIFVGAFDGRLVKLDARTGRKIWDIQTVDPNLPYTVTQAPRVVKGKVLIGNSGAEYGVRGYITAYDARDGKKLWRFYTIPNPTGAADGEASDPALKSALATWPGEGWKQTGGGGTVWDATVYDPDLNLIYFGTGNGTPWSPLARSDGKADNLFLSSIVAVNADTGQYAWHYQVTPNDAWDFDADQPLILADLPIGGASRRVIMQASKNGFFYVLDARDGKFISAKPFAAVTWAKSIDPASGRPVEAANARYQTGANINSMPGPYGAHNWHPMAFSPKESLVYIPAIGVPFSYEHDASFRFLKGAWNTALKGGLNRLQDEDAAREATRPFLTGTLVAWDPVKQEQRWKYDHKYFWNGGVLATAGDLVFQGDADGVLRAFNARDGKVLWESPSAGQGIIAAPMTYEIDGEQYVAVLVGAGGAGPTSAHFFLPQVRTTNGRIMVFKLGGKPTAPIEQTAIPEPLDLTEVTTRGDPVLGGQIYDGFCSVCHSANVSGQFLPNLRRSPILMSAEDWKGVVYDGKNASRGMAAFKTWLTEGQVEHVRAYVLSEARKHP